MLNVIVPWEAVEVFWSLPKYTKVVEPSPATFNISIRYALDCWFRPCYARDFGEIYCFTNAWLSFLMKAR